MASTRLMQRHASSQLHHSILLALLSLAVPSLTQFTDIPLCADSCVASFPASCNYGLDLTCLCTDNDFLSTTTCCVESSCSSADQETAFEYFRSTCLTVGITVAQQPSCSVQSSVGVSSAAASSAAASSFDNAGFAAVSTTAVPGDNFFPTSVYSQDFFPTYTPPSITTDPAFYPTPDSNSGSGDSSGDSYSHSGATYHRRLSSGGKAGIGVGSGAIAAIVGALALLYRRRQQRQQQQRALHAEPGMAFNVGSGGAEEAKAEGVVTTVPVGAGAEAGGYGYGAPAGQQPMQGQPGSPPSMSPPPPMPYAPSSTGPSEVGFSEVSSQGPMEPQNPSYGASHNLYTGGHSQTPD